MAKFLLISYFGIALSNLLFVGYLYYKNILHIRRKFFNPEDILSASLLWPIFVCIVISDREFIEDVKEYYKNRLEYYKQRRENKKLLEGFDPFEGLPENVFEILKTERANRRLSPSWLNVLRRISNREEYELFSRNLNALTRLSSYGTTSSHILERKNTKVF